MTPNTLSDVPRLIEAYSMPEPNSGCWLWVRNANRQGYGKLKVSGRTVMAHRASYTAFTAPIPAGLQVCHRCDTPPCVNPEHLFLGTSAANHADRNRKDRQASGDRQGLRLHPDRSPRGERNGSNKLTTAQVLEVLASPDAAPALARRYGVTRGLIYAIRHRRIWKHLTRSN